MKKSILILFLAISAKLLIGQTNVTLVLPNPCANSVVTQTISLSQGWGMFSTYIDPAVASIDTFLIEVKQNVSIVKNGEGAVYWPFFELNQIGNISDGEGFQIRMTVADTLSVTGIALIPELTPISLPQGWSIFGYLRQSPASIDTILNSITGIHIVKDGDGQVYWPFFQLNQIGNINPGEGYQIRMEVAQVLVYPPNSLNLMKSYEKPTSPVCYTEIQNTGVNATVGIPLSAWDELPAIGNEIGIFDESGNLVGAGVFDGGFTAITLWGDDSYTNPPDGIKPGDFFTVRVWKPEMKGEKRFSSVEGIEMNYVISMYSSDLNHWEPETGNPAYQDNGIFLITSLKAKTALANDFSILSMPNPFKEETEIRFNMPYPAKVKIEVFNVMGARIETLVDQSFETGSHTVVFHAKDYPDGHYYYRFVTDEFISTGVMSLIR